MFKTFSFSLFPIEESFSLSSLESSEQKKEGKNQTRKEDQNNVELMRRSVRWSIFSQWLILKKI